MHVLKKKEDIRDTLGVSLATVHNWIRTAAIPPPDCGNSYSEQTYNEIIDTIKRSPYILHRRANRSQNKKKYNTYLGIKDKKRKQLLDKVIEAFQNTSLSIHEGVLALSWAMLKSNNLLIENSLIYTKMIYWMQTIHSTAEKLLLFSDYTISNEDDDFIGAFYQSVQSISAKSAAGAYYTPPELLTNIQIPATKKVLDPCCGSGGIFLQVLHKNHNAKRIYARDTDIIALHICEVNLVLFFNNPNIQANITQTDCLCTEHDSSAVKHEPQAFDYIITNPPWGTAFSTAQKNLLITLYPEIATTEAFSIVLYRSAHLLSEDGTAYFFLPYSFLTVRAHKNIRKYILNSFPHIKITLLDSAFKGVVSKSILLCVKKQSTPTAGACINIEDKNGKQYVLDKTRATAPEYMITATVSNADSILLKKISTATHSTLLGNADFALGIVTGNNKRHILEHQCDKSEPLFKGKNILPYTYTQPECFIVFTPEHYQQTAPVKYYRTKKIVYRFISDRLICALDTAGRLFLNSANVFIPHNYPMETIVCLFNSSIYTFIYRKKFHSTKVLKAHLQSLPLPNFSQEDHARFKRQYKNMCSGTLQQEQIDLQILAYFGLTAEEYTYIKDSVKSSM